MPAPRIAIIGGSGRLGRWYAKLLGKTPGGVTITGRNPIKLQQAAQETRARSTTDNQAAAQDADIVILSTPPGQTPDLIKTLAPVLRPNTLLCDWSRLKTDVCQALQRIDRTDLETASFHPLHGPRVPDLKGRTVLSIPLRTGRWYAWLEDWFRQEGAQVIRTTAAEHDRAMARLQGLTHFASLVAGATLAQDADAPLAELATPASDLLQIALARVLLQDPALYAQMQTENPENSEYRRRFVHNAVRLAAMADAGDSSGLEAEFKKAAAIFPRPDQALARTDAALKALQTSSTKKL